MPKIFYTERDIEDMHAQGITSINVHDGIVLTDLARERMFKFGMLVNRIKPDVHPEEQPLEVLIHRIKAAVLARLNGQIDPVLLDTVIRRVMAEMK